MMWHLKLVQFSVQMITESLAVHISTTILYHVHKFKDATHMEYIR